MPTEFELAVTGQRAKASQVNQYAPAVNALETAVEALQADPGVEIEDIDGLAAALAAKYSADNPPAIANVTGLAAALADKEDAITTLSKAKGGFGANISAVGNGILKFVGGALTALTKLGLGDGGTNTDLSATGPGFLRQASTGANVTVDPLSAAEIADALGSGKWPTFTLASVGGTANAITATFGVTLAAGQFFWLIPPATSTNTTVNLNVDSVGNKRIKAFDGSTDPAVGDLVINRLVLLYYDGTVFRQMMGGAVTTEPGWPAGLTTTELGYLDGVTSAIQTQLGNKAPAHQLAIYRRTGTDQSLSNGDNIINFNTESMDDGNNVSISSGIITFANTGRYRLTLNTYADAAGYLMLGRPNASGTDLWAAKGFTTNSGTGLYFGQVSYTYDITGADAIKCGYYCSTGGSNVLKKGDNSSTADGFGTWLQIERLK